MTILNSFRRVRSYSPGLCVACISIYMVITAPCATAAELQPHTAARYEKYVRLTEDRINSELRRSKEGSPFLVIDFNSGGQNGSIRESLKRGEIHIQKMHTLENQREIIVSDGMIHHWMGAIFVPGIQLAALQEWIRKYGEHDRYFSDVENSRLISRQGDSYKFFYRLKRKKVITVVYNSEHTATYLPISDKRIASKGVATRIAQLADPGTPTEKELPVGEDGGYLWRLNSYWRFEEQDGGVFVECETLSLSRDIPFGVGWLIRGLVESVPRESLINTLTSLREGVLAAQAK
jgi:hypothetical protein